MMKLLGLPKTRRRPGTSSPKKSTSDHGGRHIQYARMLGLFFCVAGFVAIGLGWVGAAGQACVDCQIPYLLSGGAAGLGLLLFGVTMLLLAQIRSECRRLAARLNDVLPEREPAGDDPAGMERPGAPGIGPDARSVSSSNGDGGAVGRPSQPEPATVPSARRRVMGWWER